MIDVDVKHIEMVGRDDDSITFALRIDFKGAAAGCVGMVYDGLATGARAVCIKECNSDILDTLSNEAKEMLDEGDEKALMKIALRQLFERALSLGMLQTVGEILAEIGDSDER